MEREGRPENEEEPAESAPSEHLVDSFGVNAGLVQEIQDRYQVDPASVHPNWADLFGGQAPARPLIPPRPAVPEPEAPVPAPGLATPEPVNPHLADKHARVLRIIHSYRARGHRIAETDPLGVRDDYFPELDPAHYGFGSEDMDRPYIAGDLPGGPVQPLRQILDRLRATYCRRVGVEFTHVQDPGRRSWLMKRMEESENTTDFDTAERLRVLEKLSAAELFERFLHTKFLGQKRFSLEGAESLIPLLDTIVEESPTHGIREIVLGMAHRGRLNVLSNVMGKSVESIFSEFEDSALLDSPFGSGDVKYHKGYSNDRRTRTGERIHLTLTSNPSHLEAVDPVMEGRAKAKQVRAGDEKGRTIAPVCVHGDAAFAGQGIVAETLNLSQLRGYSTGGTVHVIVNNQIGFTTTPTEARSTLYCTDVAKMIQVPVFHVNGDDPEAVLHCVKLALSYRQRFGDDVVIDMVCYRRHGHNEGDEPSFTQPKLYAKIRKRPSVRKLYTERLLEIGILRDDDVQRIEQDLNDQLQQALQVIKSRPPGPDEPYEPRGPWTGFARTRPDEEPDTGVPIERLAQISERLGQVPSGFGVHKKLASLLEKRGKSIAQSVPLDWAMGEALAFGSLLLEGTPVRLSGQDSSRGTFSHRHAVFVDQESGEEYAPLDHIAETQARFEVYDSLLSEAAVLGFEYGYSLADPTTLTLWEAQFGDFANGAQVIIDQFITSAHVKWQRMSGLVMLLPHGYEGQGPEHSSARVERFLQLCAEDSMQVVNCTTPAQYFHVLRRQVRRTYRAPLVIFTPKSLLRLPAATSRHPELLEGTCFEPVIDDALSSADPDAVKRVVFCSGKVYYDLLAEREKRYGDRAAAVALVRVEELYPWHGERIAEIVTRYANIDRVTWCQEEPANMGAWTFVRDRIQDVLRPQVSLAYAGRVASASPAVGSRRVHNREQMALLEAALAGVE
ncbi:MAG: 2-oxoglutarate dehydrogenase E1 component [Proteobacteria bacterium]|nr:2-oxoglutarate dehydrogenase E1 component [Pseudomonadota bacterium]